MTNSQEGARTADEITFPEDMKALARDLAQIATRYKLAAIHGTIRPGFDNPWRPDVQFHWNHGRHDCATGEITISSTHEVLVKVTQK